MSLKPPKRALSDEISVLRLSFETQHGWLKHYDILLISITTFLSSVIIGFLALKFETYTTISSGYFSFNRSRVFESSILAILVIFNFLVSRIMLCQVREAWERIVRIEKALGFYEPFESLNGQSLFSRKMLETASTVPTFFKLSFVMQGILLFLVAVHPFL